MPEAGPSDGVLERWQELSANRQRKVDVGPLVLHSGDVGTRDCCRRDRDVGPRKLKQATAHSLPLVAREHRSTIAGRCQEGAPTTASSLAFNWFLG